MIEVPATVLRFDVAQDMAFQPISVMAIQPQTCELSVGVVF